MSCVAPGLALALDATVHTHPQHTNTHNHHTHLQEYVRVYGVTSLNALTPLLLLLFLGDDESAKNEKKHLLLGNSGWTVSTSPGQANLEKTISFTAYTAKRHRYIRLFIVPVSCEINEEPICVLWHPPLIQGPNNYQLLWWTFDQMHTGSIRV